MCFPVFSFHPYLCARLLRLRRRKKRGKAASDDDVGGGDDSHAEEQGGEAREDLTRNR